MLSGVCLLVCLSLLAAVPLNLTGSEDPLDLCLDDGGVTVGIVKHGTPRVSDISQQRETHVQVISKTL